MIHTHETGTQKVCIQHTSNVDITHIHDAVKALLLEVLYTPIHANETMRKAHYDAVMTRFKQIFVEV